MRCLFRSKIHFFSKRLLNLHYCSMYWSTHAKPRFIINGAHLALGA